MQLQQASEQLSTAIEDVKRQKMQQALTDVILQVKEEVIKQLQPYIQEVGKTVLSKEEIQKVLSNITVNIPPIILPEVKVPELPAFEIPTPQVTVNVPDVIVPKITVPKPEVTVNVPDIKVPTIKVPTIKVPKPEVTVNVPKRDNRDVVEAIESLQFPEPKDYTIRKPMPVMVTNPVEGGRGGLTQKQQNLLGASAGLVDVPYDYVSLTYSGINITQAVFKQGGSSGTVVATLNMTYSGVLLTSVTRA